MEFILYWIKKKYIKNKIVSHRRVARIWKRGGGGGGFFERVRKVQTTLTRIFIVLESESHGLSENWDGISRKARKFKRFFCPKTGDLQKKKVFTEIETDFSAKIGNSNVFSAQKQVISKKKRSSPKLRLIFRPKSEIQTLFQAKPRHVFHNFGTQFPLGGGGLFSIFHQKSASKAPKTCDFAYFTSQWGGPRAPRPPWLRYWSQIRCKDQFRAFLPIYKTVPSQSIVKSMNKDGEEEKGRLGTVIRYFSERKFCSFWKQYFW